MYLLIIVTFLELVSAKDCSLFPSDYTKIVGKNSEIIVYPVSKIFKEMNYGDELKLIDGNNKLTLIPPIQLKQSSKFPIQPPLASFISFSVFTNVHNDWLNKFQLLGRNANQYVLTTNTVIQPGTQQRNPVFNSQYMLDDLTSATYYSSAILDLGHILIDCSTIDDQQVETHFFYLVDEETGSKTKIPNVYPYSKQSRQIQTSSNYIYRATLSNDQNPSILEIFSYDVRQKTITLWNTFDQNFILKYITNITDYKFELQDFKVGKLDEIALLDKLGNILYFQYAGSGKNYYFNLFASELGPSFSFDFNFTNEYYAVVQHHKLISQFRNYQTYETVDDISTAKVHLGKDFMFLTSPTQVIQFNKQSKVVFAIEGDFTWTLSDYNQNDFISIGTNSIKHYQMFESYLLQYVSQEMKSGSGTLSLNGCSVTIDYQNVDTASYDLIQVSKGNLLDTPLFSDKYGQLDTPRNLVDGPSQQLTMQAVNGGSLSSINQSEDFTVTDTSFKSSEITFVQTASLYFSEFTQYYIVTQNSVNILNVYLCELLFEQSCTILPSTTLQVRLNSQNTIVHTITYDYLTVAILVTRAEWTELVIHKFKTGYHDETTYNLGKDKEIDSFYRSGCNLILYSSSQKTMRVYYLFEIIELIYIITPKVMKDLGITDWNPTKIFTNELDGWIFVQNGDQQIVIMNLSKSNIYYSFALSIVYSWKIQVSKELKIMNFYRRFGLIQLFDNGQISFNVFNKIDETNIYLEKSPSFYGHKVQIDQIVYAPYLSIVNIMALKESDNSAVVLTYYIDKTDHNSLHSVYKVDKSNKFLRCIQNQIFLFSEQNLQIIYLQPEPQIASKVVFNDNTFVTDVKYNLVYQNENNLTINQQFRLVNSYSELKIIQDKFNATIDLTSRKYDHFVYDMGVDWYQGEVVEFELSIPQIHGEVTIINPVEPVKKQYQQNTKGIADLDADYVFILKNDTFVIMSKATNLEVLSYTFIAGSTCTDILGNNGGQFLLRCTQATKIVIVGVICNGQICILGISFLETNQDIIRAQIEDDVVFLVYRQRVEAYECNILLMGQAVLQGFEDFSELGNFQYGITIQKIYNTHYHIYCTDHNHNFIILEYVLSTNKFTRNNKLGFDLAALINQDFYLLKEAYISYISVINVQSIDTSFKADYIIFSTIGPHYGIHLEFTCANDKCQLSDKKITFVLQGYGDYELLGFLYPQIVVKQSLVLIPYTSNQLLVYNLPSVQTTKSAVLFFGALKIIKPKQVILNECYFYGSQAYLLSNLEWYDITLYKINKSPQLMFNGEIDSSQGIIKIKNYFTSDQAMITIKTPNPNDVSPTSGHTAIWVIFGLIGGGIIIGAGYYYWKKRKQQKVETLM